MKTKDVEAKIKRLQQHYKNMCLSLAAGFEQAATDQDQHTTVCSSSYLRDLPLLAKEIQILQALVRDLQDEENFKGGAQ